MNQSLYFKALDNRLDDTHLHRDMYRQMKGVEGESKIAHILKQIPDLNYLNNVAFNIKNRIQIDFIIVDDEHIFHLEVKHYKGDYHIIDGQMKNEFGNIFDTPFKQMNRAAHELQLLTHELNITRPILSYLIFTNPTFTLHTEIPNRKQVFLPTELHKIPRLFKNFRSRENKEILNKIKTQQQDFSNIYPEINIPFEQIKPGLRCPHCRKIGHIQIDARMRYGFCLYCSTQTSRQKLYLDNLLELHILKREPFTLNDAERWCGGNKWAIRKLCNKHFKRKGQHTIQYFT
ncbi:nuclease-related domain-containing protein [Mammaliicoccus sp. Dog046]|uniref:nuclease-related domain-containing protein n=1 Tax=Mammaliicoccus sp. Dog046 TaxID=3034233 RepID=UPI002B260850|nr:nuclease-related domain-containing protein [Mammaliicoccus sp. Dog046]WQK85677.1 nuclease-related domain-containing protein [Mammaliicoccus sp. Dog046]